MFEIRVAAEEEQLLPFCGYSVVLLMKDGTQKVGRLTACRSGRIVLNGTEADETDTGVPKAATRRKRRTRTRNGKGRTTKLAAEPLQLAANPQFPVDPFSFGPPPNYAPETREVVLLQNVNSVLVL